jgi:hypothetical protein
VVVVIIVVLIILTKLVGLYRALYPLYEESLVQQQHSYPNSSKEHIPLNVDTSDYVDYTPTIPSWLNQEEEVEVPKKQSKGEVECKRVMEAIYGVPFQTQVRPKWLANPLTGRAMELDVYNVELAIAVEYNGAQHYKYTPFFHKSVEDFTRQVARDAAKIDICDRVGVYVITVPFNVPLNKIERYIRYYLPDAVSRRQYLETANK